MHAVCAVTKCRPFEVKLALLCAFAQSWERNLSLARQLKVSSALQLITLDFNFVLNALQIV